VLTVLVGDPETALRVLPSDIITNDPAGSTFNAGIVGYRDLVFFPLIDVGGADAYASEVERAFHTHLRVFNPEVRVLINLVSVPIELIRDRQ
jgi:hypothetical protein